MYGGIGGSVIYEVRLTYEVINLNAEVLMPRREILSSA